MGYTKAEVFAGLNGALATLGDLLPRLCAELEAFEPEEKLRLTFPPKERFVEMLAVAEQIVEHLRTMADVGYMGLVGRLERVHGLTMRWQNEKLGFAPSTFGRVYANANLAGKAARLLYEANESLRLRSQWRDRELVIEAWKQLAAIAWRRDDALVLAGSKWHSEGVRDRAERALRESGASGGWELQVNGGRTWICVAYGPFAAQEEWGKFPIPSDPFSDAIYDPDSNQWILPHEAGDDMLP